MDTKRVEFNQMKKLPFIIAVDFDGTLVKDGCFPEIGEINKTVWHSVQQWKEQGCKLVLWTCRDGEALAAAVGFCFLKGLEFDAVNQNIPEVIEMFGNDTRKVYANIYLDDKVLSPSITEMFSTYKPQESYKPWHSKVK